MQARREAMISLLAKLDLATYSQITKALGISHGRFSSDMDALIRLGRVAKTVTQTGAIYYHLGDRVPELARVMPKIQLPTPDRTRVVHARETHIPTEIRRRSSWSGYQSGLCADSTL